MKSLNIVGKSCLQIIWKTRSKYNKSKNRIKFILKRAFQKNMDDFMDYTNLIEGLNNKSNIVSALPKLDKLKWNLNIFKRFPMV